MKLIKFGFVIGAAIALVGCTSLGIDTRKSFAQESKTVSPLVIPAGVPNVREQSYYTVPAIPATNKHSSEHVSLIPPGSKIVEYRHELHTKKKHKKEG